MLGTNIRSMRRSPARTAFGHMTLEGILEFGPTRTHHEYAGNKSVAHQEPDSITAWHRRKGEGHIPTYKEARSGKADSECAALLACRPKARWLHVA
jgi:hypothetical protein